MLLIVSVLVGYSVAMFSVQQELKQYRELDRDLDDIVDHLIGFAQVNGRLPCPDTSGDVNGSGTPGVIDGQEDWDDLIDNVTGAGGADLIIDGCKAYAGFLPAGTLGLTGDIGPNGNLLDPWGLPYRYHVSNIDAAAAPAVDLVSPDGIREEGLSNVTPNMVICDDSDNATAADITCAGVGANNIVVDATVVVISTGRDLGAVGSTIQAENRDDFHDGTNDRVYTFSTLSEVAGSQYDDGVRWISPNVLYSKMIEAGQLP